MPHVEAACPGSFTEQIHGAGLPGNRSGEKLMQGIRRWRRSGGAAIGGSRAEVGPCEARL